MHILMGLYTKRIKRIFLLPPKSYNNYNSLTQSHLSSSCVTTFKLIYNNIDGQYRWGCL